MLSLKDQLINKTSILLSLQILCLILIGTAESFSIAFGDLFLSRALHPLYFGIGTVSLGFWIASLWQSPKDLPWRSIILGAIMVAWYLSVELRFRSSQTGTHPIPLFFSIYMVTLPFAAITRDKDRQAGLRAFAWLYICAALVLVLFGLILLLTYKFPGRLCIYVKWDGTRLAVFHHPNTIARIFMIATALSLGFLSQIKQLWKKGLLLVATALFFLGIALTNSRACILVTCVLLGGNVFFGILRNRSKCFLPAAAASIVAVIIFFIASTSIFEWNSTRLIDYSKTQVAQQMQYDPPKETKPADPGEETQPVESATTAKTTQSAETIMSAEESQSSKQAVGSPVATESPQGTWLSDMVTLNSRTHIWSKVIQKVRNDPSILLLGTIDTRIQINEAVTVSHTHNAWLETLLRLGLPGLLLSLVFTWQAIGSSIYLLWNKGTDLWKKNIAMLISCLLVTSMMEPMLFFTDAWAHFIDIFFFLCLGYMTLWSGQLRKKAGRSRW